MRLCVKPVALFVSQFGPQTEQLKWKLRGVLACEKLTLPLISSFVKQNEAKQKPRLKCYKSARLQESALRGAWQGRFHVFKDVRPCV